MKLYLTIDSKDVLKKYYSKKIEREYNIIDTTELKTLYKINEKDDIYKNYILSQEIEKQLKNSYTSKRFRSLIYIIENIDNDFIENLIDFLKQEKIYFTEICLIDYNNQIDPNLYDNFNNIL